MDLSDERRLDRWFSSRDGEAFRGLVDAYGGMVLACARRVLGNLSDAEEVTQECFLALATSRVAPTAPLGPWLHRVATNRALNRLKSDRARRRREENAPIAGVSSTVGHWPELEALLDSALAELPMEQQEVLVGHYLLGKSQMALSEELGVSRQTVTYRVARGLEALRGALQSRGVTLAAAALSGALASLRAEALPPALAVALGKSILAGACLTPETGAAAGTIRVLMMTTKVKIAVLGAILLCAGLVWTLARPSVPEQSPGATERNTPREKSAKSPVETPIAVPPPSAPATVVPAADAVATPAVEPKEMTALWEVTSYTWNGTPSGESEELFHAGDTPQARLTRTGDDIKLEIIAPWATEVPFAMFSGTVIGAEVALRSLGKEIPVLLKGRLLANETELTAEGGYNLAQVPAEQVSELEGYWQTLRLKKINAGSATPSLKSFETEAQRREQAKRVGDALHAYALAHAGKLPSRLEDLVPDYLPDTSLLETANHRMVKYSGGAVPSGLLAPETPWESFQPDAPMAERLAAWEAYQQERWGGDSPLLPAAMTITFDDPHLELSVDALGRVVERTYSLSTPGIENNPELRRQSAENLKGAGLAMMNFLQDHDGVAAPGWLSLYPEYINDASTLTNPFDEVGTLSYELLPGGEGSSPERPIAAANRDYGNETAGRHVLFGDGHVEFMTEDEFAALCARFQITP